MGRPKKKAEIEEQQDMLCQQEDYLNETSEEVIEQTKQSKYTDPTWHDFVMSQFVPEELDPKGNPKVDGLRRVVEGLLGEIIESRPIQSSADSNLSAVNWYLAINWVCGSEYVDLNNPPEKRIFGAFADASVQNCKAPYNKFLSSLADTRAESKALRRALRLRCISSEEAELGETDTFEEKVTDGNYNGEAPINQQQKMMIKVISERLSIDPEKLAKKTYNKEVDKLTKENGANLIVLLNKYQTCIKEQSQEIPDDIKVQ